MSDADYLTNDDESSTITENATGLESTSAETAAETASNLSQDTVESDAEEVKLKSYETTGIKVFLRLKPFLPDFNGKQDSESFFKRHVTDDDRIDFLLPQNLDKNFVDNSKSEYSFTFTGIIGESATQKQVFNEIAKDSIASCFDGFNATIFAYGQTGSGKTFTITGGTESYSERGIIPRTLESMFEYAKENGRKTKVFISYLEIYNNVGYDLLQSELETSNDFFSLPRVTALEDEEGKLHFNNLSTREVSTQQEALDLLFLGDTNRAVAETPMNLHSSRSHCIFTIHIEQQKLDENVLLKSKLHIIDLAGSERVHKTHSRGQVLQEAKYINSSLHFLEMVIISLQKKSKRENTHVPYRNSLMTQILKDSLGGNCLTRMVATMASERSQTEESLSTCKFAQRVQLIQNYVKRNETYDPNLVITKLNGKIKALKSEIALLKSNQNQEEMTDNDHVRVKDDVERWIKVPEIDVTLLLKVVEQFGFKCLCLILNQVKKLFLSKSMTQSFKAQEFQQNFEEKGNRNLPSSQILDSHDSKILKEVKALSVEELVLFDDKEKAFNHYQTRCKYCNAYNNYKKELEANIVNAKESASKVVQVRDKVNEMKALLAKIEKQRKIYTSNLIKLSEEEVQQILAKLAAKEVTAKNNINVLKKDYLNLVTKLKESKKTIECLQKYLANVSDKIRKGFKDWYSLVLAHRSKV